MRLVAIIFGAVTLAGWSTAVSLANFNADGSEPADGFYTGAVNPRTGKVELTYRGPVEGAAERRSVSAESPLLRKRNSVNCDGFALNHGDTDAAWRMMKSNCDRWPSEYAVTKTGDAVAFFCRYQNSAVCSSAAADQGGAAITGTCGSYNAGNWVAGDNSYAYGYTNWRTHSFCDCPPGSSNGHCQG